MDTVTPSPSPALSPDFDLRDLEWLHGAIPPAAAHSAAPAGHLSGYVQDAVAPASTPAPTPAHTPAAPETHPDERSRSPEATPSAGRAGATDQALLDALHRQYLRRLHDPHHVDEDALAVAWAPRAEPSTTQHHTDPFLDLIAQAHKGPSLEHMVSGTPNSTELLACFDDHGGQDLLAPAVNDSVMHLLAPPEFTPPAADPRSLDWIGDLPVLTRREHHGMTLDSAMDTHSQTQQRVEPLF